MTEEFKAVPQRPDPVPPAARDLKVQTAPPARKEEAVQCEAARLADKLNANA
ncbi:MAG TPA: hypothetical protein VHZ32_00535 [Rhizomicrobium sp.]|nr:hypothetical protein [Rhizomicrobium sp.]